MRHLPPSSVDRLFSLAVAVQMNKFEKVVGLDSRLPSG